MDSKNLKGMAVISIADGRKVGVVERTYLDPVKAQLVGFVVGAGGLFGGVAGILDAGDVHAVGPDALTVDDDTAVRADAALVGQDAHLIDLDELAKRRVVTEGGAAIGQVDDSEFDPNTFKLTALVVSPGLLKSNPTIPIDQIISIGQDVVVVRDAVGGQPPSEPAAAAQETTSPVAAPAPGHDEGNGHG